MELSKSSKQALPRLIMLALIISLLKITDVSADGGDIVNKSANGKPSGQHTRTARGDYDSYGSHIDYFEPSPVDISTDESEEPLPATADCPPICGEGGNDESNPPLYQPSAEEYSAGYHSDEDQGAEVGPENHDLEGNVMWTSE